MARTGFWNKILHVNLTDRTTWVEEPGDEFFRKYGGGRGLIAHYILKDVPKGADPLGPENVFVMAPGVLTGTPVPGAARHSVGGMSPLSGWFGEAEAGGSWGAELKRAGWDAIVCHGAADAPVYISIKDGDVEVRDAAALWGKVTGDVEAAIHQELGDERLRVAQCGPAGENLVRIAAVCNDLHEFAGRSGLGAVMGSKKLKAIAVCGSTPVPLADQKGVIAIAKWVASTLDTSHLAFHEYGTGGAMLGKSLAGGLPSLNYRLGEMETIDKIDAIAVKEQVGSHMEACFACSVRCKKVVHIEQTQAAADAAETGKRTAADPEGRYRVDPKYGGPEYESLASLGSMVGVEDLVAVCKSNEVCNYLGLDTISTGSSIAWAMEAWEKGIITAEDTDGVNLRFHHGDAVIQMAENIAYRRGFGDILAEGSARAAERLGEGSDAFLTTVKGMEMAMHDPRHMPGMRRPFLLAPTGGDHMGQTETKNGLRNQVGMCHFLQYDEQQIIDIINAVTGWGIDDAGVLEMAHRGHTLARLVNVREGFTADDDRLPKRFTEALPKHDGLSEEFQAEIVKDYYEELGWDNETGVPTAATVEALGIAEDAVTVTLS